MSEKETTVTTVRRLQFCSGHRVYKHESKCAHLHGHNYVVFLHARAQSASGEKRTGAAALDELGRVIDFAILKERFTAWIDDNWDHGFILWEKDVEGIKALKTLPEQKLFLLPANPTAENMALHLLSVVAPVVLSESGVVLTRVVLWETENCFVEVGHD